MRHAFRVLALGSVAVGSAGSCAGRDLVVRTPGPSNNVEAVVVATSPGAGAANRFEVHVVRAGETPRGPAGSAAELVAAVRAAGQNGPALRWAGPTELRVEYLAAEAATVARPAVVAGGLVVRVSLDSGVAHAAPPPPPARGVRSADLGFLEGRRPVAP